MPSLNERLIDTLEELGYNDYEDAGTAVHIEVAFDDGRNQSVFIQYNCDKINGVAIRHIWSPVCEREKISPELATRLLENNHHRILGSWNYNKEDKLLYFSAKVPANISSQELDAIILAVASDADRLEKTLMGQDLL